MVINLKKNNIFNIVVIGAGNVGSRHIESLLLIDIQKAFLESSLDEDVYLKVPEGLRMIREDTLGKVCKLNKAIYGLVQASKAFFKELRSYLIQKNFQISVKEPCLFKKKIGNRILHLMK